jgi:2-oxoglutarate ferredoxin oxidoreductase subunit delta
MRLFIRRRGVFEMPMAKIYREKCKGCELCVYACPQKILGMSKTLNKKGYFFAQVQDPGRCIGCGMCALTCPDVAIEVGVQGTRYVLYDY